MAGLPGFDLEKAARAQEILSSKVRVERLSRRPGRIIGLDVSYKGGLGFAAAAAFSYEEMSLEEVSIASGRVGVPYIPGFLAFREAPLMIRAFMGLKMREGVLMVNGHGLAHPRGCGIASYLGLVLGLPSIGVAKKILVGRVVDEEGRSFIEVSGKRVGVVIRKGGSRIYATIGHMVSLEDVEEITRRSFAEGHTLPAPLEAADRLSRSAASSSQDLLYHSRKPRP